MPTIFELKEQAIAETPLLLFDCTLADGRVERWSTHRVDVDGEVYEARVLRHNVFEIQAASDQGVDGIPRISLALANADSHFSQIERSVGIKGARLSARFVFYDLKQRQAASEARVAFLGICNPPEEITESTFRVTAANRMSLQRVLLPPVRIQRRCPWTFPATAAQREEAVEGGEHGKYSRFYRCGYSPDMAGGKGTLNGGEPFTACGYTRADCAARGMMEHFGGIEFVPSSIQVRSFGEKGSHSSAVLPNEARYNDFAPLVYGTAWYNPPVVFARNDGNLTRMEVLLGMGEMAGVLKVLVNEVEIPLGQSGRNMTGTGWYNVPTLGTRSGGFNLDFLNSDGTPAGDPYGSMAYLSVVVPNRINEGKSLPTVKVLVQGLKLPTYAADGQWQGDFWTANPAWIALDVLRRSGWTPGEIDVASFAAAAAYCVETIEAHDLYGNAVSIPRFECNLALQRRKSAGDVVRGVRTTARLYLTYDSSGKVQLKVENTLALQQPEKPAGSNATQALAGGWPAYEFGDGSNGFSGILRRENGEPHIRVWSRSSGDTANRITTEFQDSMNEFQQDGYSLVDAEDVALTGQEICAPLAALGLPNLDQAARIVRYSLERSVRGNVYVAFGTSVKALGIAPGDLITLTYLKEGFDRQLFRVLKIAPGANFATAVITAQIHFDEWYSDVNGESGSGGRRETGSGVGTPRPIIGTTLDEHGEAQLGVTERPVDGGVELEVAFTAPAKPALGGPGIPLLSLAPTVSGSGALNGGQTLYYAVSGVNEDGVEGRLSFIVRAVLPDGNDRSVKLTGLSFSPGVAAFHVYRGPTPLQLYRIASNQAPAAEFTDAGLTRELAAPPDPNFDHANFYWRMEQQPEQAATIHSATTVGNGTLQMVENRHRGAAARITRGPGAGQERAIAANTSTTLTVAPPWDVEPTADSRFVVAEAGWKFGALANTSPVSFQVTNHPGETVQVCGRAANVNDGECALELSPVTRWALGGSGATDAEAPPKPSFGFGPSARGGSVEVRGIGFAELTNTRTISSGTLTLHYWNELNGHPTQSLSTALGAADDAVVLNAAGPAEAGRLLQIEAELLQVVESVNGGTQYLAIRGVHGTTAAEHAVGTPVYHLERKTSLMPFPDDFFGSPYSGSWSYPIRLADVRLASAELFVTNRRGNSPTEAVNFTQQQNYGWRTLSGGQYTLQTAGFLAVDENAVPALVAEDTHSVRDIFAVLGQAADAEVQVRVNVNGVAYCTLAIAAGQTASPSVDGFGLAPLASGARVTLSVLSVGQTIPGSDLTVVIRL